ncbi:hypothetical protein [Kitasatospora sp. NPDC002040]|uniref:hypothetical protein n=1 Tax=Kitasatospora sp. NPDC002040 TaxID=3154661 RepID=UPI003333A0B3
MTTQGERHTHRAHGSRRRTIALCAAGAVAIAVGVVVTETGDWLEGAGRTTAESMNLQNVDAVPPSTPLSEEDFFVAERYFPQARPLEHEAFKARRTVGLQGRACVETLADRTKDVLHESGCEGYVVVGYAREDAQVVSSVTVLRFADGAAAERARQVIAQNPAVVAFATAETGVTPSPAGSPSPNAAKPVSTAQVDVVGHYLTVTSSRFADLRPAATDNALDVATRAVAFTARAPFMWI